MPLTKKRRFEMLRKLDNKYLDLNEKHYNNAPRGGSLPIGGGEWMDTFFRMEALRGMMNALRDGKSLNESVSDGKAVSEIAVKIWNTRREWQVHRYIKTAHSYLDRVVRSMKKDRKAKDGSSK